MGKMKDVDIEINNAYMTIKSLYDAFEREFTGLYSFKEYLEEIEEEIEAQKDQ